MVKFKISKEYPQSTDNPIEKLRQQVEFMLDKENVTYDVVKEESNEETSVYVEINNDDIDTVESTFEKSRATTANRVE